MTLFWFGERLAINASLDEGVSWIIPSINRIDRNLSNKEGIVVRTPDNRTEIHYRSSQFTGTPSKTDLQTNFRIITGFENEVEGTSYFCPI